MTITNETKTFIGKREVPQFLIHEYEGGRHWPESGDYKKWLDGKIEEFGRNYIYISHDTFSTYSGGLTLLVKAVRKSDWEKYLAGTICPECGWEWLGGPNPCKPDDVACHLVEYHGRDEGKVLAWLREQIEEAAFYEEP